MTPTQLIHEAIGSPVADGCIEAFGRCYLCSGEVLRGRSVRYWMGDGFTDQARVGCPTSDWICEACCYVTSRVSPVPGKPPGKCSCCDGTLVIVNPRKSHKERKGAACTKCGGSGLNEHGGSWRSYCHWYDQRGYGNASKAEKPALREFLGRAHDGYWFLAIAVSGQKHVLPFAPMNHGGHGGLVAFESDVVRVPEDLSLMHDMTAFLTAGALKSEIETGEYGQRTWRECEDQTRAFEDRWSRQRGSGWFSLAIWLAQREETEDATQKRETHARRNRVGASRAKPRVQPDVGPPRSKALVAPPSGAGSEPNGRRELRSMGGTGTDAPPHRCSEQLALFGVGTAGGNSRRSRV